MRNTTRIIVWLGGSLWLSACGRPVAVPRQTAPEPSVLQIDAPALYPETVVWSPSARVFRVGSVRRGGVHGIDAAGAARPVVQDPRLCSVLGIAVDEARDRIWVTNSDLGIATLPSGAGTKNLAGVGVYALSTGRALAYADLAPLAAGPHLMNGIALDRDGNAYVTDSFAPVIYAVAPSGEARVLLRDARFAGNGVNLNGLVVHPDGYLLVVKKSDGALFKVPLAQPGEVSQVATDVRLVAGDGLVLASDRQLVVIANRVPGAAVDAALVLDSDDAWRSARRSAEASLGAVYPTTAAVRDGRLYVLHSQLDALLGSAPDARAALLARPVIAPIGTIDATGVRLSTAGPR